MNGDPSKPQSRDDLPWSLFPRRFRPLREMPERLEAFARRPWRVRPQPQVDNPAIAKANLSNPLYTGKWTLEQRKKYLAHRRQIVVSKDKDAKPVVVPEGMKAPAVPMAFPLDPSTRRGRALRAVLSQEEYDLYLETYIELMRGHEEEWDQPEDQLDVQAICMETVIQFRLQMQKQAKPYLDNDKAYHDSTVRAQKARENLAATRSAREAAKAEKESANKKTVNIAIIAGELSQKNLQQLQREAKQRQLDVFSRLDQMEAAAEDQPQIIDAEIEPEKE